MRTRSVVVGVVVIVLFLAGAGAGAQVPTGTITGTVTDNSRAIMPGVVVSLSGERLIGGTRTASTNSRGEYRFAGLPPGTYDLKFELTGFKILARQGIAVSAGFVAVVDPILEVGGLEETITVAGESPTVDTKSNVQQTVMSQAVLESVPTGRDVWSLAKIIPGVTVGTYDVGGTQGMQQTAMSAHGSRGITYAMDGLAVNWPGGGSTMLYYDQGMFEEISYQTSAAPAEIASAGVFINMVTKTGSNRWRGDARYYYANDSMQAENFADVTEEYNFPGGNPVTRQYDFNVGAAGPIVRDRVWFNGSFRRWRVDKTLLAAFNADGSNAIDDNMIWSASGKVNVQFTPNHRLGVVYTFNNKNRYHKHGDTCPQAFCEDKATAAQLQDAFITQGKYTAVLNNLSVLESTVSLMKGTTPEYYQKDVQPTDIRREDTALDTATGAGWADYRNPNYRLQFDNTFSRSYVGGTGSHNFKVGVQFSRLYFQESWRMNGDMRLIYNDKVPVRVQAFNTPVTATSYVHGLGFFAQDSWSVGRKLSLNIGLRADRATGWMPAQTSPAGRWVGERTSEAKDVYEQWKPVWRAGGSYDPFGNGRTAVKATYSRFASVLAIGVVTAVNPFNLSSSNISWKDLNGNDLPDPGELGAFEGFTGGATTRYADANGPAWEYSDEFSVGVEHQLLKDVRVGAMYYHRTNRDIVANRNMAVPSTAYAPVDVPNPLGGAITIYNLNPSFVGKQETVRDDEPLLDTVYDGIEVTASKRFSNRWQMLLGFTAGLNDGGQSFGEFNDPNNLINQQGIVGNDATYQLKLSGTWLVPKADIAVSGSLVRNTGYPRQSAYSVTRAIYPGLTRSSQTVRLDERGDLRRPTVVMLDLRFSRPIPVNHGMTIEPQVDVFNVTNNDVIVNMVDTIGSRYGYPSEILAPRIFRVGLAVKF